MTHPQPQRRHDRRGNTMILVAGILVLLVIIATAFITRTQGGRITAVAVQQSYTGDNRSNLIADMLAQELGDALFAWPLDVAPGGFGGGSVPIEARDSNTLRLPPDFVANPKRYNVDPTFLFNFAPDSVVPFTNWPDELPGVVGAEPLVWPQGEGSPNGAVSNPFGFPILEGNPYGNPGMGDTRWLRDLEPMRWDTSVGGATEDGVQDSFKYWRHLTNIARPNNGWRICRDISDITGAGVLTNLNIPVEQWLASIEPDPSLFNAATGNAIVANPLGFDNVWNTFWFSDNLAIFGSAYKTPSTIPPNFYHLKDLDGDGFELEPGDEQPQDEFVRGTRRWYVGRRLSDTDGDGFTDSFWFLAPTPASDGVRQVVAVSVIDNSSMVNANVATRFDPATTIGETPADIALFGDGWTGIQVPPIPNWSTGYFDNYQNRGRAIINLPSEYVLNDLYLSEPLTIQWDSAQWPDYLAELGVLNRPLDFPTELIDPLERRLYWLNAASQPLTSTFGLTPFALGDELELRMYYGHNYPRTYTRFERSVNIEDDPNDPDDDIGLAFLRSDVVFEETNPWVGQLNNPELLHDNRHRLTLFSGARNDLLPNWLRWRWDGAPGVLPIPTIVRSELAANPGDLDNNGQADVLDNFYAQTDLKLDLREQNPATFEFPLNSGFRKFHERLPWMLLNVLADGDEGGVGIYPGLSYFGSYTGGATDVDELRRLSASWTANILAYRDADGKAPLFDETGFGQSGQVGSVPITQWDRRFQATDQRTRFLGLEKQPFLVEAFVGHVYDVDFEVPTLPDGSGWTNSGKKLVLSENEAGERLQSTVSVVQIANPFSEPIDLTDEESPFEIVFFGQAPISLTTLAQRIGITELPAARDNRPSTMIIYALERQLHGDIKFDDQWLDFLDIEFSDHPDDTIIVNLKNAALVGDITPWSVTRDDYDDADETILLRRRYPAPVGGQPVRVVIDRFDRADDSGVSLLDTLTGFASEIPPTYAEIQPDIPLPTLPPMFEHPPEEWTPLDQSRTHWVQFVRATRAWGNIENPTIEGDPTRSNPRFISSRKIVRTARNPADLDPRIHYSEERVFSAPGARRGVSFNLAADGDAETGDLNAPWITLDYTLPDGTGLANRKPTFFDMNRANDPASTSSLWSYPDKGFYHSPFALQMLHKDGDFQQTGELLNVFLWTHELEFSGAVPNLTYLETTKTFSEFHEDVATNNVFTNRLAAGETVGIATNINDPRAAVPNLPPGMRLFEGFVCDGPGFNFDPAIHDPAFFRFGNALGFSGAATPGLINVNTAPVEVLRTLPHWYKLIHDDPNWDSDQLERFPRSVLPEALISYRERFANELSSTDLDYFQGPDYSDRDDTNFTDIREERGIAAIGELRMVTRPAPALVEIPALGDEYRLDPDAWRSSFAALSPFDIQDPDPDTKFGAFLSTDVVGANPDTFQGDGVAADAEEVNLLMNGATNLVTTRSDVFTVYFRVRSFRQTPISPITGGPVWDATNPEAIVDDARYVMLVDRSRVNAPGDKPQILFVEKLPN